ncbi:hypothetical protein PIB30_050757 [Stylosanthes scabra]|uniref:Uncharacterized protein n=1 Tax=Stylosanthes scabra TaxID=79078 RepID=A0ABU6TIK7_9FABA|nr:hypothetical protein [Stylosanthes scabra]
MPPPTEGRRGCSARISGGRERARPRAGGRMRSRAETMVMRRLSTIVRSTFSPESRGDGDAPHEPDHDFFSGADIELARIILQGEGSGSGTAPQAAGAGPSFNRFGAPNQIRWITSRMNIERPAPPWKVYKPGPPLQPHHDPEEQCQGFQYYQPSQQSYIQPSSQQYYQLPSPHCPSYYQPSRNVLSVTFPGSPAVPALVRLSHLVAAATVVCERVTELPLPPHDDPSYHSAPKPSPHQIVRPRAQRPQRDRQPPPCGTSSRLHHRPARGGDRD